MRSLFRSRLIPIGRDLVMTPDIFYSLFQISWTCEDTVITYALRHDEQHQQEPDCS